MTSSKWRQYKTSMVKLWVTYCEVLWYCRWFSNANYNMRPGLLFLYMCIYMHIWRWNEIAVTRIVVPTIVKQRGNKQLHKKVMSSRRKSTNTRWEGTVKWERKERGVHATSVTLRLCEVSIWFPLLHWTKLVFKPREMKMP